MATKTIKIVNGLGLYSNADKNEISKKKGSCVANMRKTTHIHSHTHTNTIRKEEIDIYRKRKKHGKLRQLSLDSCGFKAHVILFNFV